MKKPSLLFILFFVITQLVYSQSEVDYYGQAMEAYSKKDYKAYLSNLQAIESSGANHPYLVHLFAGAYALNNMPKETLIQMKKLGDMGLYYSIEDHPDFKSFVNTTEYKEYKQKYEHQNLMVKKSEKAFDVLEKDLIPEGIAFDPVGKKFYIGSLHKNKIVAVDEKGKAEDFKSAGEDGLFAIIGMKVDSSKGTLWVCSSAEIANPKEVRQSGVFKFDLKTKKLVKKYLVTKEGEDHFLNDLVIAPTGDVFISDSHGGTIFKIPAATNEIEELRLSEKFGYPNGITISPDGKYLFLASFHHGIIRVTLKDKSHHIITTPDKTTLLGIDGLYFYNNTLVAVQNGIEPNRIVKFSLNPDFTGVTNATILEANNPLFDIPTTGVIVGNTLYYIANSHLRNLEKGKIVNKEKLRKVSVLKVGL